MRDWTMDVPVIAVVDGLGDRFVQLVLVEASCAKYDWQLERFSTVADALNAGVYRLRSGSIATAASPHSVEAQWGGRDRAPYKIMLVVAEPGNAEAGVFYMGGNLKGGELPSSPSAKTGPMMTCPTGLTTGSVRRTHGGSGPTISLRSN